MCIYRTSTFMGTDLNGFLHGCSMIIGIEGVKFGNVVVILPAYSFQHGAVNGRQAQSNGEALE